MRTRPALSVIVVFHNMKREAPRTLFTLSGDYQRGVKPEDYEVIAVDVGSKEPLCVEKVAGYGKNFRLLRMAAAASPARAINQAAQEAEGAAIALCIDGARILSPGIIRLMLDAFETHADPVVATLSWHLGPKVQNESMLEGYNQTAEDALLDSVDWRTDGYEFFRISSLAASSKQGWFGRINESNCLAVSRDAWRKLGGLHEGFRSPGGDWSIWTFTGGRASNSASLSFFSARAPSTNSTAALPRMFRSPNTLGRSSSRNIERSAGQNMQRRRTSPAISALSRRKQCRFCSSRHWDARSLSR